MAGRTFLRVTSYVRAVRFWIALLLVALAWAGCVSDARAQTYDFSQCNSDSYTWTYCPSTTAAIAAMNALHSRAIAEPGTGNNGIREAANCSVNVAPNRTHVCRMRFWRVFMSQQQELTITRWVASPSCPAGQDWNEITQSCGQPCHQRPNLVDTAITANAIGAVCHDGCMYAPTENAIGVSTNANHYIGGEFAPSGTQCAAEQETPRKPHDPDKPVCQTVGSTQATQCVSSEGRHCIHFASGQRQCWNPFETGERMNREGTEGSNRQKAPALPTPPDSMKDPVEQGTATTTVNGDTYNTSTYSGGGNRGGQNTPGQGGNQGDGGDGGNGDNGDDGGSVSGGTGCSSAPVGSGGNPLLQHLIQQVWRVRCPHGENELPGAADAAGGGDDHPTVDSIIRDSTLPGDIAGGGDATGYGLPRACPLADVPALVLRGYTVNLPFGTVCGWLEMLAAMILIAGHALWAVTVARIGST